MTSRLGLLVALALLLPLPALATPGVTWFGGTRWDPVDGRWEAVEDSVWTFESGVGSVMNTDPERKRTGMHLLLEGWSGQDWTGPQELRIHGAFRRVGTSFFSGTACVGVPAGLGGNASLWVGRTEAEADSLGWENGRGYGDLWYVERRQTFVTTGGPVGLALTHAAEVEAGYDSILVQTSWEGGASTLLGLAETFPARRDSLVLTPGVDLPAGAGEVTIHLIFRSDALGSDETTFAGAGDTDCGAWTLDDLALTGGIVHTADFETGEDGWEMAAYPPVPDHSPGYGGDWADLRAVDSLERNPNYLPCLLGDSVLVFTRPDTLNPGRGDHPCGQYNAAVSPVIDLAEAGVTGRPGLFLEYETYREEVGLFRLSHAVQWYPQQRPGYNEPAWSNWAGWVWRDVPEGCSLGSQAIQADLSGIVPATAEQVRVAIVYMDRCAEFVCECFLPGYTTPWIDDVRVAVFESSPTAAGPPPVTPTALRLALHPTPMRAGTSGSIRFTLPADGPVTLAVFDVRGRERALLYAGPTPAGDHSIPWRGTDDTGAPLPAGIYLLRLQTPTGETTAKTVLLGN